MRQQLVRYAGTDENGVDQHDLNLTWPEAISSSKPTSRQLRAIEAFYPISTAELALSEDEAHWLLTMRDYALGVIEALLSDTRSPLARAYAIFVVVFLASDEDIRRDVLRYMDRRFADGLDPDDLPRSITRTKHFAAVQQFIIDVRDDIAEAKASGTMLHGPA